MDIISQLLSIFESTKLQIVAVMLLQISRLRFFFSVYILSTHQNSNLPVNKVEFQVDIHAGV